MKIKRCNLRLIALTTLVISVPVLPFTIESPRSGEQVMPGQSVWLIVQPDSSAEAELRAVQVLAPGASGCEKVQATVPIQCQLTIPDGSNKTTAPLAVDIRVHVTYANGMQGSASTYINVASVSEALTALRGNPRERPLMFDAIGQEKDLTVLGWTVDGATRDLRGRSKGTLYSVSNPAVVKVREDGRVIAQAAGAATITVQNGSLFFEVPVIVCVGVKVR